MDDALLMRVLHGLTNLNEQIETALGLQFVLIAIIRDADAAHQFHHEVGAA